jgi:hypothetical protein
MRILGKFTALVVVLLIVGLTAAIVGRSSTSAVTDDTPATSGVLLAAADGANPPRAQESQEQESTAEAESPVAQQAEQYQGEAELAEQPTQWQAIDDHNNATRGPRQPIAFNHRFHSTDLQIDCMYCHIGTDKSQTGVVPALEVCMGCHRIAGSGLPPVEELRGYWERGEPVPWEWVNKLPDHVQFQHQAHVRAKIDCTECHGPVEEMDRVYQWASFRMGWCLECHRQEPAETDVATDYMLLQAQPPPAPPEGNQDHSFYPISIDQKYGYYRGPIDCASCHY